jgi:hypothetical protein
MPQASMENPPSATCRPTMTSSNETAKPRLRLLLLVLGPSAFLCAAITKQSLWIDEAVMAYFASHDGFLSLITTVIGMRTSDPQMPLYIIYLWGWAKIFGTSEYALRAANLPFAVLFVGAMAWTSRRVLGRPLLWLVLCASPFVWFYMNEARPYIGIIACSAVSTGAVLAYSCNRITYGRTAPWFCLTGLFVASGLQMLSACVAPSLVVFAALALKSILRDWKGAFLFHTPLFVALGGYYLWTLSVGAGGMRESPGFANLAFSGYEFMGFSGLGPPRDVLRTKQNVQLFLDYWPWMVLGLTSMVLALAAFLLGLFRQRHGLLASLPIALGIGLISFVVAAEAVDFRFWGRHLSAFFPLFSFTLITALGTVLSIGRWEPVARLAVLLLTLCWLISDARLWALQEYRKDDYRLAAREALEIAEQNDATIVWAANEAGGSYYGLKFESPREGINRHGTRAAIVGSNWTRDQVTEFLERATSEAPVILALSKPDIYDSVGGWNAAVYEWKAHKVASLNAFKLHFFDSRSLAFGRQLLLRSQDPALIRAELP